MSQLEDAPAWTRPQGVPPHLARYAGAGVWLDRTIGDLAVELAEREPHTVVFPNDPDRPSYQDLAQDAEALAAGLDELGLREGDVLSFQLPNWREAAVINLASAMLGCVVNPIVTIYRDAEVQLMLADSGARAIFVAGAFRGFDHLAMVERMRASLPALRHVIPVRSAGGGASYDHLVALGRGRPSVRRRVEPHAAKLLLYTSGTTGRAKGVLHSHSTLARVAMTSYREWGLGRGDVVLMPSPITHISGYCNGLETPFLVGSRTVLMERWDAAEAVDLIEAHQIAATVAATPFLKELADEARRRGARLPSLRLFACGGAAVPADVVREANGAFAHPCAFRVYGSSETPLVTLGFPPAERPDLAATTDGAVRDYEVLIVDETGAEVAAGGEGEILARGPAMFLGYADAAQTREALTADGFFRTGDLGRLTPEGGLEVTGRKKDLIIRGGENISAKEIEDVLHRHPAVRDAAVVSMPHPRLGEGVCAFITLKTSPAPSLAELGEFVTAAGLARQKCPERVEVVEALPVTASGKVRKDILRQEIRTRLRDA